MKRPDLNLLVALEALVRTRSVKSAADELHLSTPAMSHTLARLRETMGDPLLVRAGRQLLPTPRALATVDATRALVAQARAILAPVSGDDRWMTAAREFVVAMPDEFAITYGPALLDALRSRMPESRLTLVPVDTVGARLREGPMDAAIGTLGALPPETQVELLQEQPLVVAMRRDHACADGELTLDRYLAAAHAGLSLDNEAETLIADAVVSTGARRHCVLRVATPYGALMAAARSELLATAQRPLVRAVGAALGLIDRPFPLVLPPLRVVQAWHPRWTDDPPHRWLRRCVAAVLSRPAVPDPR